jgi:hypothetical protein
MQDPDLLLTLAEIAGVFVGFGALISVRSGGALDPHELVYIRSVVWLGLYAVIAGLLPMVLAGYGLEGRDLWLACSLSMLTLIVALAVFNRRTPEHRADLEAMPRRLVAPMTLGVVLISSFAAVALGLVALDPTSVLAQARYTTAVALALLLAATALLVLVFTQGWSGHEASPNDR